MLRNCKHDKPQAMNSAPSVNDPIAAATQSQNHINSNLPVNPPMPRFSGVVSQYPMHNYGMSYPYFPMYPTPHGPQPFPFPQQYASLHGPSHKHQYNSGWNEAVSDPVTRTMQRLVLLILSSIILLFQIGSRDLL